MRTSKREEWHSLQAAWSGGCHGDGGRQSHPLHAASSIASTLPPKSKIQSHSHFLGKQPISRTTDQCNAMFWNILECDVILAPHWAEIPLSNVTLWLADLRASSALLAFANADWRRGEDARGECGADLLATKGDVESVNLSILACLCGSAQETRVDDEEHRSCGLRSGEDVCGIPSWMNVWMIGYPSVVPPRGITLGVARVCKYLSDLLFPFLVPLLPPPTLAPSWPRRLSPFPLATFNR